MVTARLAVEVGESCAAAVTVTVCPMGGVSGGLYTPLALIEPSVAFPPKIPRPPTGPTYQRITSVVPPVSVALKVTVFAGPDDTVTAEDGEVIATIGAGVMVTAEVAETF